MLEGGQGANKQKMEYINGRALIPAGSNLLIINPNDDSIEKTIPAGGSVSGIAEGKDKCLWIAVNGETPSFVKINTDDFTVDETIPAEGAKLSTGWIPSIGFCASKKDNSLYWRQGATIYKFDMTDKTVSELVKFSDNSFVDFIYGDINIHPETDEIYAGTIKGYQQYQDSKIHVINSENGEAARSPYLKHMRFMAGPFFTADFNQENAE